MKHIKLFEDFSLNEGSYLEHDGDKIIVFFDIDGWDDEKLAKSDIASLVGLENDPLADDVDNLASEKNLKIDWDISPKLSSEHKDGFIAVEFKIIK